MSSRTQAYCTNYCTNAVDPPRYLATFSDTTIKKDPRNLGSSWLVNDGCWWRWGGVELLAARLSPFIAVHHSAVFRQFLHLKSRRCPWCDVGVGVSIGVSR